MILATAQRSQRKIFLPAILLAGIVLISRLPFTSEQLYHIDSVNFALALERYDLVQHQPHPPDYFLYVQLGKAINTLLRDPNLSYITLSVTGSIAATVLLYLLALESLGFLEAIAAALIFAFSPLFWFYGEVALSYAPGAAWATAIAFSCYKMLKGGERYIPVGAIRRRDRVGENAHIRSAGNLWRVFRLRLREGREWGHPIRTHGDL